MVTRPRLNPQADIMEGRRSSGASLPMGARLQNFKFQIPNSPRPCRASLSVSPRLRGSVVLPKCEIPAIGEALGILILALLTAWFLAVSWRKWPDPLVDTGMQWYTAWRLAHGAHLYHDFAWNYGPLSIAFNASLFRCFGAGMMVLVTANLLIYGLILALAYAAIRRAWGRLAAFAAGAVFISVFSFSHLADVGNYNFATPYAHESTHGLLLMLCTLFVVARWSRQPSRRLAFLLGLCGGLAAVLKPEFMLAGGLLGLLALVLRARHRLRIQPSEWSLLLTGVALPTLGFAAWFARYESWKSALVDACQAWGLVLFNHANPGLLKQGFFSGFDHPWQNAGHEAAATLCALAAISGIWAGGWFVNRWWTWPLRVSTTMAAVVLVCSLRLERGWIEVGRCFPGLIVLLFLLLVFRLAREFRENRTETVQFHGERDRLGRTRRRLADGTSPSDSGIPEQLHRTANDRTVMALALVVLAGAMLARMPLFARVYHFGFFQAALAGMVLAAALVGELPLWTGPGAWGRRAATLGGILLLTLCCWSISARSRAIWAAQTEPVGSGSDRFYAFRQDTDPSASVVNWALQCLRPVPPQATLLVLPEGVMINYLSRHVNPLPDLGLDEEGYIGQMRATPPDYVLLLARDMSEFGITNFGAPGNHGYQVVQYLRQNYTATAAHGRDFFLRHNSAPTPAK